MAKNNHQNQNLVLSRMRLPPRLCPSCKKADLEKETNLDKKITMTVVGEEDIETEIGQIKERKLKGEKNNDPDVSTPAKENAHRAKRKEDIRLAIETAKLFEDK